MRIISGKYRGRKLFVPKGLNIRPTADRVKESVFNILGESVVGSKVLDLFAGSGALGIEALSRGASEAVFVDHHPTSVQAIKRNLAAVEETRGRVFQFDPLKGMGQLKAAAPFDIVFLDPPYHKGLISKTLGRSAWRHMASDQALAVVEHPVDEDPLPGNGCWEMVKQRRYGKTLISFLAWAPPTLPDD